MGQKVGKQSPKKNVCSSKVLFGSEIGPTGQKILKPFWISEVCQKVSHILQNTHLHFRDVLQKGESYFHNPQKVHLHPPLISVSSMNDPPPPPKHAQRYMLQNQDCDSLKIFWPVYLCRKVDPMS